MEPNCRRCLSCRKVAPRSDFWRVIRRHPDHAIVLDQGAGRSAYLCPQSTCWQSAHKKDRLSRSLKAPVPEAIYQALWHRLPASEASQGRDHQAQKTAKAIAPPSAKGDRLAKHEPGFPQTSSPTGHT